MPKPTSDEKVLAALAHISILLSFFGPIGSTLIWITQRTKSKYVRFHALQAMGYQVFSFWVFFIGIFVIAFGSVPLIFLIEFLAPQNGEVPISPFIIQPLMFVGIFGLIGSVFLYGFIGAVFCMLDRNFSYLVIGTWLKKKLLREDLTEEEFVEHETNWVSGICHATTILRFMGLLTPLIIWFSQKEQSVKIRFHALQAVVYQAIAILAGILSYMIGALFYFLFLASLVLTGVSGGFSSAESEMAGPFALFFFIFMALMVFFGLASIIVVPIYYLLSIIASISTIRGRDFKYPILGRVIANRLAVSSSRKEIVEP